jgi:DNA-binding transcriptional ArsR family regulator
VLKLLDVTVAAASVDAEAALRAIANPARRRALGLVSEGERTSGELAAACGWSRPAASQQLKVLRDAGLVDVRAEGNQRLYRARQEALAQLRAFLDDFWGGRLASLEGHVARGRP